VAKILVVDDVPDNVKLLKYELSDDGYEVLTALSGQEALDVARAERPDVILLDVMMPGLDGIEVCVRLKRDPELEPIPVIMVTARERDDDVVRGLDAGAHDYITKPFNSQIVLARVRAAARAKAAHDLIAELTGRLAELATHDGLTGLKNRRSFSEELQSSVSFASRHPSPLSLTMLDVDQFKSYNDTFGHPAGDAVLCAVAEMLRAAVRDHDMVFRYGGEEFAVLSPGTDGGGGRTLAERLRVVIEAHRWPLRSVTASLGVAMLSPATPDASALLEWADRALYHSKRQGRNRVTHHDDLEPVTAWGLPV
jgi:two-component system, cell cycle response regulator